MAKKSKNIDALQRRHARDMLKVYRKRATEVKAALVKVIKSGGDSTVLRQEKNNINNVIKRLNKELNKLARNQVDSSYFDGRAESLKDFENLNLDKIDKELGKTKSIPKKELTALTAEYTDHTEWIVRRLNDDVNGFLRNGFDDINEVVKAFNKLTKNQVVMEAPKTVQTTQIKDLKDFSNQILSSQTTREDWAALAKSIEQKFLRRDVFTVPYFNKSKEVVRNVKVKSYAEMLARTMTAQTYRDAAEKAILDKFGKLGDLVEIMGDSDYHECDECKKFEHQILSLTGQTKGYTTIDEAKEQGLFHPNCIHWFEVTDKVLDEYEGLKGDKPKDIQIKYEDKLATIDNVYLYNNKSDILAKLYPSELNAIDAKQDKRILLKYSIKDRNRNKHNDLTNADFKNALTALYKPNIILQDSGNNNYYHFIRSMNNTNYVVLLDKAPQKDYFEIVHIHKMRKSSLTRLLKKHKK